MADYRGPATSNEAVVIEAECGRKVPDIYATGVSEDPKHGTDLKMGQAHAKRIHNDIYRRYGQDSPLDEPC